MTLAQIMTLALRQLDEDPEDISEYDDLFRVYANEGYRIAVDTYVKPRETRYARSDEHGLIMLEPDVRRVVELKERLESGRGAQNSLLVLSADGTALVTNLANRDFILLCEVTATDMEIETDEPTMLPKEAHNALADYICYRHLSNGNMAKQSKAQHYQTSFYQAMQRIRSKAMGSVRNFTNLYAATDIRNVR